jgi:hypothetical protein
MITFIVIIPWLLEHPEQDGCVFLLSEEHVELILLLLDKLLLYDEFCIVKLD